MSERPIKTRQLFSSVMGELVQGFKGKDTSEQSGDPSESSSKPSSLEQAREWIDAMQGKQAELLTNLSAKSPWFGSAEKRLTGLGSPSLFIPVDAATLAESNDPFSVRYYLQRMNQQSDILKEQLLRRVDRLTGVRAKVDEWETTFPEDE